LYLGRGQEFHLIWGHNRPAPHLWRSREKGVAASVDIVYSQAKSFQVTDVFGAWTQQKRILALVSGW